MCFQSYVQSFPTRAAPFLHPPTALRVGGKQIIMVQRQFSVCVLRLKLFCDIVHGDPNVVDCGTNLICAPVAEGSLFFAFNFDEQLQKKDSEGIVMAELWFHLARLGTLQGTSDSVLLLQSQIAE